MDDIVDLVLDLGSDDRFAADIEKYFGGELVPAIGVAVTGRLTSELPSLAFVLKDDRNGGDVIAVFDCP